MGAERWLKFEAPKKVKAYLKGVEEIRIGDDECWFEWKRGRLEIGYSFGGQNRIVASFISRELARRFPIVKIGADSTGWYGDADWEERGTHTPHDEYGPYSTWAAWMADYKREWDMSYKIIFHGLTPKQVQIVNDRYDRIENGVHEWFEERDAEMGR